jgi:hypothetical protein
MQRQKFRTRNTQEPGTIDGQPVPCYIPVLLFSAGANRKWGLLAGVTSCLRLQAQSVSQAFVYPSAVRDGYMYQGF